MGSNPDKSVITIGIDLGTTNSEIAVKIGDTEEIIKNSIGDQYTPSVFGIDRSGNEVVGKKAYDRVFRSASEVEFPNYKAEIKRLMGTGEKISFPRLNRVYSPEEISAEILKSLKSDLLRKYPEASTLGVVITIPAYFETLQIEATKRAGKYAGFEYVVLLQEPIAAAIAYGFRGRQNENWLIYDLGGGTFDVSVISTREGVMNVLEHGGDNHLGGKDIDRKFVEEIIKPEILKKYLMNGFDENNLKYRCVFAKLKAIAENAKIELSTYQKTTVEIDNIGVDEKGEEIYLSINYSRAEFEELIKPIVSKTIEFAKSTIKRSGVSKGSINRVILVGGPTQIPYIRTKIKEDLGIEIDTSADPFTTVARGACLFGLGEKIPQNLFNGTRNSTNNDEIKITINYEAMTSEEDQMITGTVELPNNESEYYIKISSETGFYNSEKIKVKNGTFIDTVAVEKGKTNTYWVYLIDNLGNILPTSPDSFVITHGLSIAGAPIPHGIGVIYTTRKFESSFQFTEACDLFFERNSIPPLKSTKSYKTVRELVKNENNPLPIKVYEGDSLKPEHNLIVTTLKIEGQNLPFTLPEGTDIDITISIDESREIAVLAYIPDVDLVVNARADMYYQSVDTDKLFQDLDIVRKRIDNMSQYISDEDSGLINDEVSMIESVVTSATDTDTKQKTERDLRILKEKLDTLEEAKSIEQMQSSFYTALENAKKTVNSVQNHDLKNRLLEQITHLINEGQNAIQKSDKHLLTRTIEQLSVVETQGKLDNPEIWIGLLAYIELNKESLSSQQESEYHIDKAKTALLNQDFEELKRHVVELLKMIPRDKQYLIPGNFSGITKQ